VQSDHSQSESLLWDWRLWTGLFIKNHSAEFTSVCSECLHWRANQSIPDCSLGGEWERRHLGRRDIITLARLWDEQPLRLPENLVPAERFELSNTCF
jgi:hypothetical protein